MPVGRRVVVVGGRIQGCEVAEFHVKLGRDVTIVDAEAALGEGMTGDDKFRLFRWFDRKGVRRILGAVCDRISGQGLEITTKNGEKLTLEADTIITALPLVTNPDPVKELEGKAPEVYAVGDCREPGLIAEATAGGAITANAI